MSASSSRRAVGKGQSAMGDKGRLPFADCPLPSVIGLIGHPIAHSISPLFQQAAFDQLGLPVRYEAWDTPPEQLASTIASLRDSDRIGANVTVPHKEAVLSLLDAISEEARVTGAVNTIVREHGRLAGHNTDIAGFSSALREDGGFDVAGARVCVLGAGGAARAVVYALLRDGAALVRLHNRTVARAEALVASLSDGSDRLVVGSGDAAQAVQGCDLLVNCTTLGMAHSPRADAAYLAETEVPAGIFVCDIVANPPETPLLTRARARGCRTLGGLPMLIRQGAAAFELWTGREAPLEVMFRAAHEVLRTED